MQTRDKYDNDSVRAIFEAIAQDTINNAGGTYQHKTGATVNHTDGYYVGVGNVATVDIDAITDPVRVAVVAGILADSWPRTLPARAQYVGTWVDGNTLYVDYTTHIPGAHNLDVALACARRHGELAVWDCKNRVSIDVPSITGGAPNADDIYQAIRALVGGTSPEDSYHLPRVSVRLCGASVDDVLARVFGTDVWSDGDPVNDDDDDDDDPIYALYNDTILPDDQIGAYTYDDHADVLTVWGFYS